MGADTVKIFCPKCQCVYHPPPVRSRSSHHGGAGAAGVDGAAFGTTFPHLFLMTFSNLVPDPLPQNSSYIPRVFGFRVHGSTRQRAGATASGLALAASSTSRQREMADNNNNNKRTSFVGKRSETASKDSTERKPNEGGESAEPPEDAIVAAPQQEADIVAANQKGNGDPASAKGGNDDDDGSRKSKTGKRKNDGDAGSKKSEANGTASVESASKKRRKNDNGNT
jgi:Casein kinase II regulatory subunit